MPKLKKSQISAFFIFLAIILLILFLFFYFIKSSEKIDNSLFDKIKIQNFVTNCLIKTSEEALYNLGKQGSIYNPEKFIEVGDTVRKITILLSKRELFIPSKEKIQNELSEYIDKNILSCLENFNSFKNQGLKVLYENPHTTSIMNEQDVSFTTNFTISISNSQTTLNFGQFSYTSQNRLLKILDLTQKITNFSNNNNRMIDLTELSNYDFEIIIFPFENNLIYVINDNKKIISKPYQFIFGIDASLALE